MNPTTARKAAALAFATKLNALLEEHGVSRRALARRLSENEDVSFETARTNVHRMLRADHVPTETTRREVARALGIDVSELEEEALSGDPFRGSRGANPAGRRGAGQTRTGGKDLAA